MSSFPIRGQLGSEDRLLLLPVVAAEPQMALKTFQTGHPVPESGIYRVIHTGHRLPHAVTICQGENFPRCAKCADLVSFELIRAVECPFTYEPIHVYELQPEEESLSVGDVET
jgi:hypothetical protein